MISLDQQAETMTVNPDMTTDRIIQLKKVVKNHTLRVENLDVYIEDQHILKDINLSIPEKSITCIIGPSGCGKSTFLKTLNRMHDETPEVRISGKVLVNDENIYDRNVNVIDTRKRMGLAGPASVPSSYVHIR